MVAQTDAGVNTLHYTLCRYLPDVFVLYYSPYYTVFLGAMVWVHRQMEAGMNPREILNRLLPRRTVIPDDIDDFMLWRAVIEIVTEPPRRKKLPDVNTMDDVIRLLRTSERIMVLTGAGVSCLCETFILKPQVSFWDLSCFILL